MSTQTETETCTCPCVDSCCLPNLIRGGYDTANDDCPTHGRDAA